jgi:hypothetical protein
MNWRTADKSRLMSKLRPVALARIADFIDRIRGLSDRPPAWRGSARRGFPHLREFALGVAIFTLYSVVESTVTR